MSRQCGQPPRGDGMAKLPHHVGMLRTSSCSHDTGHHEPIATNLGINGLGPRLQLPKQFFLASPFHERSCLALVWRPYGGVCRSVRRRGPQCGLRRAGMCWLCCTARRRFLLCARRRRAVLTASCRTHEPPADASAAGRVEGGGQRTAEGDAAGGPSTSGSGRARRAAVWAAAVLRAPA